MEKALVQEVWRRANNACEYCQIRQDFYRVPFQIDHIIARQHGGRTTSDNLGLSCFHCNTHKGPNIASLDPLTDALVPLFHPRRDRWSEHFRWNGALLVGLTPVGRATVRLLAINAPVYVILRRVLIAQGEFPPALPEVMSNGQ